MTNLADHTTQSYEQVAVENLIEHPQNPHVGDDDELCLSMQTNGFYGALYVQRSTHYVCAGNTRYRAACRIGMATVPVIWIDCTDERALAILLVDNRMAQKGKFDDTKLREALEALTSLGELTATGYDESYLADLVKTLDGLTPYSVPTGNEGPGDPGAGQGSAIVNPSFADIKDQYAANGVRSLILDFAIADFETITPRLAAARQALAVETNSALLIALLDVYDGSGATKLDDGPAEPDDFYDIANDPAAVAEALPEVPSPDDEARAAAEAAFDAAGIPKS